MHHTYEDTGLKTLESNGQNLLFYGSWLKLWIIFASVGFWDKTFSCYVCDMLNTFTVNIEKRIYYFKLLMAMLMVQILKYFLNTIDWFEFWF